ncbi:TerB family tellurite resistance protein, partial [bacterium]|nr:TerB family tellurite resistance protein [bacterium]
STALPLSEVYESRSSYCFPEIPVSPVVQWLHKNTLLSEAIASRYFSWLRDFQNSPSKWALSSAAASKMADGLIKSLNKKSYPIANALISNYKNKIFEFHVEKKGILSDEAVFLITQYLITLIEEEVVSLVDIRELLHAFLSAELDAVKGLRFLQEVLVIAESYFTYNEDLKPQEYQLLGFHKHPESRLVILLMKYMILVDAEQSPEELVPLHQYLQAHYFIPFEMSRWLYISAPSKMDLKSVLEDANLLFKEEFMENIAKVLEEISLADSKLHPKELETLRMIGRLRKS